MRHTVLQTLTQLLSTSVVEAQASSSGHHRAADGPVPHPPHVPAPLRRQRSIGGSLQELTPYLIKRVPDLIRHHASGGSIVLKIRGEALRVARELVNAVERCVHVPTGRMGVIATHCMRHLVVIP